MKLQIVKLGRPAYQECEGLVARYEQRLAAWFDIQRQEIRLTENKQSEQAIRKLAAPVPGRLCITLDERGTQWSSPQLARKLSSWQEDPGVKQLLFVIGGPYGLPRELVQLSDLQWSLSQAVFTADLAWVLVWEQLYRASCINHGIAYHHA